MALLAPAPMTKVVGVGIIGLILVTYDWFHRERAPNCERRSVLCLGQLTLKPQSPGGLENFRPLASVPVFDRIVQPDYVSL